LAITVTAIALNDTFVEAYQDPIPHVFMFLWILLPFLVFSTIGISAEKRPLRNLVLVTLLFWIVFQVVAQLSSGGVNFAAVFAALLSPLLVGIIVVALEHVTPRGNSSKGDRAQK
jgi:hypothetical protein